MGAGDRSLSQTSSSSLDDDDDSDVSGDNDDELILFRFNWRDATVRVTESKLLFFFVQILRCKKQKTKKKSTILSTQLVAISPILFFVYEARYR